MLSEQELKALVTKYQACWEVFPVHAFAQGGRRSAAFELEWEGTCSCNDREVVPGCSQGKAVYAALRASAARRSAYGY